MMRTGGRDIRETFGLDYLAPPKDEGSTRFGDLATPIVGNKILSLLKDSPERTSQLYDLVDRTGLALETLLPVVEDRKSTRLNSSHEWISYAVFCLKKKNNKQQQQIDG